MAAGEGRIADMSICCLLRISSKDMLPRSGVPVLERFMRSNASCVKGERGIGDSKRDGGKVGRFVMSRVVILLRTNIYVQKSASEFFELMMI